MVNYYTFVSEGEEDNSITRYTIVEHKRMLVKEIIIEAILKHPEDRFPIYEVSLRHKDGV